MQPFYPSIIRKHVLVFILLVGAVTATHAQVPGQLPRVILDAVRTQKKFTGTPILNKGSQVAQIGYGFPNNLSTLLNFAGIAEVLTSGNTSKKSFGPVSVHYEYFLRNDLGIGAFVSHASASQYYNLNIPIIGVNLGEVTGRIRVWQLGLTSSYHFYTTDKIDPYMRGGVGINIWRGSYKNGSGQQMKPFDAPSPFSYQGLLGVRYFVKPTWAVFGEGSYSNLKLNLALGASYKLK